MHQLDPSFALKWQPMPAQKIPNGSESTLVLKLLEGEQPT